MGRRRDQFDARRAFTAIEITIVVLITGILASVGAPRYLEALSHYRVEAAARRVASDLRLARVYALKTSAPQTVDFDAVADSYALPSMSSPDRPSATYSVALASLYSVDLVSSVFGSGDLVQFDMYGRPDRSGAVIVRSGAKQRTVQVDAVGQVSIL